MTMVISKGLLTATKEALQILQRHYPRKFTPALERSEDAERYQQEWAQAFVSCDYDKISEAARRWVATEKYPPSAAEVAEIARRLTFENRPAPVRVDCVVPPPSLPKNGERIDALYYAAKERLIERGYSRPLFAGTIAQVWALLMGAQETDEQRQAVRLGDIELDVWYRTIDAWLSGDRPKSHPINNLGSAIVSSVLGKSA